MSSIKQVFVKHKVESFVIERVKQICFLLAQHTTESCPISKNLGDVTKLLADIQKKWLESCFEEGFSSRQANSHNQREPCIQPQLKTVLLFFTSSSSRMLLYKL